MARGMVEGPRFCAHSTPAVCPAALLSAEAGMPPPARIPCFANGLDGPGCVGRAALSHEGIVTRTKTRHLERERGLSRGGRRIRE